VKKEKKIEVLAAENQETLENYGCAVDQECETMREPEAGKRSPGKFMEYFIVANSFAAPFFSDDSTSFIEANSPREALESFASNYKHPCGLYAAVCYRDANAREKGEKPLAKWLCNHEAEKMALTEKLAGYSYMGNGPGDFTINGKRHVIVNPKGGRVIDTGL
jgi:hypothetical protein